MLELGCGLGLCGILAARLNPHGVVVLTDGDELTMDKVCVCGRLRVCVVVTTQHPPWGSALHACMGFPSHCTTHPTN